MPQIAINIRKWRMKRNRSELMIRLCGFFYWVNRSFHNAEYDEFKIIHVMLARWLICREQAWNGMAWRWHTNCFNLIQNDICYRAHRTSFVLFLSVSFLRARLDLSPSLCINEWTNRFNISMNLERYHLWYKVYLYAHVAVRLPHVEYSKYTGAYEKKSSINSPIWVFFLAARRCLWERELFCLLYHFWCQSMRELLLECQLVQYALY